MPGDWVNSDSCRYGDDQLAVPPSTMVRGQDRGVNGNGDKWRVFLVVVTGVFLSTMDSSMVNVALPTIMRSFSAALIEVQWVVLSYLLVITVSLLFWGIMADHLGKDLVYLAGLLIFSGGSIGCSLSGSLGWLIGARLVEGTGAAMMMSSGPAIIRDVFSLSGIGRALGMVGIATSLGLMTGPLVSGLLLKIAGWRAIFLVNVPVAALVIAGAWRILRRPGVIAPPGGKLQFDLKGALLWTILISGLILYGHYFRELELFGRLGGLFSLLALGLLFIWAERGRRSTILPLHLFAKRYYHIGLITSAQSFAALFVVLILMPFYLDYIKGLPSELIGLTMMSVPLTLFVVSPTAGMLFDRFGSRYLTTAGLLLSTTALLLLSRADGGTAVWDICWRLALLGMGQSMFLSPNTASLLSRIGHDDASVTSGLLATARNLGMLAGSAFAGIVFAAWFSFFGGGEGLRDYHPGQVPLFVAALRATLLCTAFFSLSAAIISWQRER